MIYFTSDLHFGHENIIAYCNRPFKNANAMDKQLIRLWNQRVIDNDTVYIIGDFSLKGRNDIGYLEGIVKKLNGRKILILGNHDRLYPYEYLNIGFENVHTSLDIFNYTLVHDPAVACVKRSRTFLCGHVHDLFKRINNVINVSVEIWEYSPVSIAEIDQFFYQSFQV